MTNKISFAMIYIIINHQIYHAKYVNIKILFFCVCMLLKMCLMSNVAKFILKFIPKSLYFFPQYYQGRYELCRVVVNKIITTYSNNFSSKEMRCASIFPCRSSIFLTLVLYLIMFSSLLR